MSVWSDIRDTTTSTAGAIVSAPTSAAVSIVDDAVGAIENTGDFLRDPSGVTTDELGRVGDTIGEETNLQSLEPHSEQVLEEPELVSLNKRMYGEIADNGFQSQAEYDAVIEGDISGLNYDEQFDRYTLQSGVDLDSAIEDWQNYMIERSEIAMYNYNEERSKMAPTDLTGSAGSVDYTLDITSSDDSSTVVTKAPSLMVDASAPSVASSYQTLGIY